MFMLLVVIVSRVVAVCLLLGRRGSYLREDCRYGRRHSTASYDGQKRHILFNYSVCQTLWTL